MIHEECVFVWRQPGWILPEGAIRVYQNFINTRVYCVNPFSLLKRSRNNNLSDNWRGVRFLSVCGSAAHTQKAAIQ